ncbi:hypothetical protein AAHA92_23188 [Salvia divinorum]|uniref:Uncharacterized protein n=1 Tax=Salvia divinorum TaxID=28513 RepID=A0ABD1GRL2_SALDI
MPYLPIRKLEVVTVPHHMMKIVYMKRCNKERIVDLLGRAPPRPRRLMERTRWKRDSQVMVGNPRVVKRARRRWKLPRWLLAVVRWRSLADAGLVLP